MLISRKELEETKKRYDTRSKQRNEHCKCIKEGKILRADSPGRVAKRLERLKAFQEARTIRARMPFPWGAEAHTEVYDRIGLERILGKNDLMSVNYLDLGVQTARSIGRISIKTRDGLIGGYGTGFLVSSRLLMTNNHVLRNPQEAVSSLIEFNLQDGADRQPLQSTVFGLEPELFFVTNQALDYTIVAVAEQGRDGTELHSFGWNPIIQLEGKVIIGEYMSIIQHPNGEPKQLALRENQLIDVLDNFLHYSTDTAPGSSGSPVFNDQWEIVALHHSGVPKRDTNGRILSLDGSVWSQRMGEHMIAWEANEGVRISRIAHDIKAQHLTEQQRHLIEAAFEGKMRPPLAPGSGNAALRNAVHSTGNLTVPTSIKAGGTILNIPLQIHVRIAPTVVPASAVGVIPVRPAFMSLPSSVAVQDKMAAALVELRYGRTRKYYDAAKDGKDRTSYYKQISKAASAAKFYRQLAELTESTHATQLRYQPAQYVYPWVDLQPNRKIKSVYSGMQFDPETLIQEDFRVEEERARRLQEVTQTESIMTTDRMTELIEFVEASLPYNCEHVVPQSWFQYDEPMKGDLHHLFACESGCNSFRGNTPYYDFPDYEEAIRDACGQRVGNKFEPTAGKGIAARATLYFLVRYPGQINSTGTEYEEQRLAILLNWHKKFPVNQYEKHRNMAIFEKQGNRNPFIDYPQWASKVDFRLGLD